jgi:hypothetical protein
VLQLPNSGGEPTPEIRHAVSLEIVLALTSYLRASYASVAPSMLQIGMSFKKQMINISRLGQ